MFCLDMLTIGFELAGHNPAYEAICTKFFEHFVSIAHAVNGPHGIWDPETSFYYDRLRGMGSVDLLRVRSLVGLVPLFAVHSLDEAVLDRLPHFKVRLPPVLGLAPPPTHSPTHSGGCSGS